MSKKTPNQIPSPDEAVHIQRMLKIIILSLTAAFVLFCGIFIGYGEWNTVWTLTATGLLLWAAYGLVWRGLPGAAIFIIALILLAMATFISTQGEGIHDIVIIAYPGIIVVASLLLRRHSYVILLLATILSIGWLIFGEAAGLYPSRPHRIGDWSDFVVVSCILLITALMSHLISDGMWRGLREARKEIREREKIELELKKGIRRRRSCSRKSTIA